MEIRARSYIIIRYSRTGIMFEEGQEILDRRYRVIKKLGGGAFGEIYKGKSIFFANLIT